MIIKTLATAAMFLIIILSLVIYQEPTLRELSQIEDIEIPISIRGGNNDDLQNGIRMFNMKNYSDANILFHKYIDKQEHNDNDYARYLLGLTYLKFSESNDIKKLTYVDSAIFELNSALSITDNTGLKEDIMWYLGKSYLIKKIPEKAIEYFQRVGELNGIRSEKSDQIIKELKAVI